MPLRDLLNFGNKSNPFESWPPAPSVRSIASGRMKEKDVDSSLSNDIFSKAYPASMIIAFGATGEKSLEFLAEKISQGHEGAITHRRALLIKDTPAILEQTGGLPVRKLVLQKGASYFAPNDATQSARVEVMTLFQQVVNYRRYQEWLQESLLDLGANIQVVFVGSLAEASIGMLGDALQILWNFPYSMGRASLFSRVVAFLSLQSVAPNELTPEETFATCREIGRFTFPGPHKMRKEYGGNSMVHSALLDALFLQEEPALPKGVSPDKGSAQLLAESLYVLMDSSSPKIWENLKNHLAKSGQVRHDTHQTVAHSLGVATVYIPTHTIKRYVAARLAYAALVGEQLNRAEGLVCRKPAQPEQPIVTARRLLTNGPYDHPSFRWILDADSSTYFTNVPDLGPDFITAFQGQISNTLVHSLNQTPADLSHLCLSFQALERHLRQCMDWFNISKPTNPNAPERFSFQYTLSRWQENIQELLRELHGWEQVLLPVRQDEASFSQLNTLVPNWHDATDVSSWRSDVKNTTSVPAKKGVSSILSSYRKDAEDALVTGFNDYVYRSIVSDLTGSLNEVEIYYADTVRPELLRFSSEPSPPYKRIMERLEWRIQLKPDQTAQLYLVCWPARSGETPEPDARYCFKSDQAQAFADAVFNLACSQITALESDLTGKWFHQRVQLFTDFLHRASQVSLNYDPNIESMGNVAYRQSYLISHDPTLSRALVSSVFPDTPRREINELDEGDPIRLTALSLRLNIPFSAVTVLKNISRQYVDTLPEKIHLYTQEQVASIYERRFWKLERNRILFPPDFVTLLADPQLVTLFCQGLFTGVIKAAYDESNPQQIWKIISVDEFAELELATISGDGLLTAFRRFVLELPNEVDLNQNPHRNFHSTRRLRYLEALTRKIKKSALDAESRVVRMGLKEELERWKKKGELDNFALSFSVILQCEMDEPIWKDW